VPIPIEPPLPGRPRHKRSRKIGRPGQPYRNTTRWVWLVLASALVGVALLVTLAPPAFADSAGPTLNGVIDNLRNWLVGILATTATLFLTIGGLRYLTAAGDPGQVEKAKTALKSAAVGYALALLAPLIVSIVASLVGG
jgi:type IV secretion system pilin